MISYILFIRRRKVTRLQGLFCFSCDQMYKSHRATSNYTEICNENVNRLFRSALEDISLIVVSTVLLEAIPVYKVLLQHERMLLLPYFLPFTNPETKKGYYINQLHQMALGLIGYTTFFGTELAFQIIKNTTWFQVNAISYDLDNLNQSFNNQFDEFELKMQFRNILLKVADNDSYRNDLIELYYWKFFLQTSLITFSVGLAVFLFVMESTILTIVHMLIEMIETNLNTRRSSTISVSFLLESFST